MANDWVFSVGQSVAWAAEAVEVDDAELAELAPAAVGLVEASEPL